MEKRNKLIERTIQYIRERLELNIYNLFSLTDFYIINATEHYNEVNDPISNAINFIEKLQNLLQNYEKGKFTNYFRDFIENEIDLEIALKKHEAHFEHVIQVFLLGYNIITKWKYLIDKYNDNERNFYFFRNFFFSWFSSSLFHDHGYLIEKAKERIEKLSKALSNFGDFRYEFKLNEIKWPILHKLYNFLPKASKLSLNQFKTLFRIENKENLDHGLISANKYIEMLEEAKIDYQNSLTEHDRRSRNLLFMKWVPNQNSIIAILLHNFKMIKSENFTFDCNLKLSCSNDRAIISYLLMICDDIQEWGRKKMLEGLYENEKIDDILKSINLIDCSFEPNKAFLEIKHKLINRNNKDEYAIFFFEKRIKKIKQKFPVEVQINEDFNENLDLRLINSESSNILIPLNGDQGYNIQVKHFIEAELFVTVIYKM